jgi:hypothetical protein
MRERNTGSGLQFWPQLERRVGEENEETEEEVEVGPRNGRVGASKNDACIVYCAGRERAKGKGQREEVNTRAVTLDGCTGKRETKLDSL